MHTYIFTHTHTHTHTHTQYYSAMKKNEILPFVTIWRDLDGIMLSKISQILYDFTYMWNLKNKTSKQMTNQKQSHRYREETGGCQRGGEPGGRGRRETGEGD